MEFASAMMLTDADGDGRAEEFMIIRDFCFPMRDSPKRDDEFGEFKPDILSFCSTRPVGTMAIYKYSERWRRMVEISPKYTNISADKDKQMECCPHGLWGGANDCSAVSMASADLDWDGKADHVILYGRTLVFYFSTDRPKGTLPVGKEYVGLTIPLPSRCFKGISVKFVDLNNNSRPDLLVVCANVANFFVYTQVSKYSWELKNNCNDKSGRLGSLTSFESYEWSDADILDACAKRDEWENKLGEICDEFVNTGKKTVPATIGVTMADLNNDGLTDAIVVTNIGYQRAFLNTPSGHNLDSSGNKFISFRLEGDGAEVNKYGIGVTLHLYTVDINNAKQRKRQFREISSYQHSTDKHGSIDDKIIFGLDTRWKPVKLMAYWPNGRRQIIFLRRFDLSTSVSYTTSMVEPIQVIYPHKTNPYFILQNKSRRSLCLSLGQGSKWQEMEVRDCVAGSKAQTFRFDTSGRMRSLEHPYYCVIPQYTDGTIVMHECTSPKAKGRSWHQTRDGLFFRQAGSNMVLGLDAAVAGQRAKLLNLDRSKQERSWVLKKVNV